MQHLDSRPHLFDDVLAGKGGMCRAEVVNEDLSSETVPDAVRNINPVEGNIIDGEAEAELLERKDVILLKIELSASVRCEEAENFRLLRRLYLGPEMFLLWAEYLLQALSDNLLSAMDSLVSECS